MQQWVIDLTNSTLLRNGWLNIRLSSLSHNSLLVVIISVLRKIWENAIKADDEYVPKVYPKATNTSFCSCNDLVFIQWYSLVLGTKFSKDSSLTCYVNISYGIFFFIQIRLISIIGPNALVWQWKVPWCRSGATQRAKIIPLPQT